VTARTREPERESQNERARTREPEQESQNERARTREPYQEPERDSQNRTDRQTQVPLQTARTGRLEQDSRYRTARTEQDSLKCSIYI
jgi:hypothetical protein